MSDELRYRGAGARRAALVERVNGAGFYSIRDLSEELGVSQMTIRRDVQELEEAGVVRSTHGGVAAFPSRHGGTHIGIRGERQAEQKRAVAKRAVEILDGQPGTIGIDAGTTTLEFARALHPRQRLRVVTQSLPAMTELSGRANVEVVGVGGVLHAESQAFAGPRTIAALEGVRLDVFLLATSSIRDQLMYCGNAFDGETKQQMIQIADRVILLVDSSKFRQAAPFFFAPLTAIDVAVVDGGATAADVASLRDSGVETVVVPLAEDSLGSKRA